MFYKGMAESSRSGSTSMEHERTTGEMTNNHEESRHKTDCSDSQASIDSTGKRKSFVRVMTRFAEKTSMQGVPYINNAKLMWAKVIWSFMLLAAIGMMGLHLWYLCDQFFQYPKVTKITLGFNTLRFPTVTLCNTNQLHRGRLDQFNGAEALKELVDDLKPENLVPDQFDPGYDPTIAKPGSSEGPSGPSDSAQSGQPKPSGRKKRFIEERNFNLSKYDPNFIDRDEGRDFRDDEFDGDLAMDSVISETFKSLFMDIRKNHRARLGHNISDMLLSCTFSGRTCPSQLFRLRQTADYGNCWSIDSDKFRTLVSGPDGGLSLTLYLETTEYLEGITNGYGLRLLIHPPYTYPFPAQEGHHVSASYETDVGLKMVSIDRASQPYGECDPQISEDFVNKFNLTYTNRVCRSVCYLDAMVAKCGCFAMELEELAMKKNRTLKPCRTGHEVRCLDGVWREIARDEITCFCPVPCSEIRYEKSFSSRQWPSDSYAMVLLEGVCQKQPEVCKTIRNKIDDSRAISYNFLKLNIYYEDLNFENIVEEPEIENAQFVSDVGGAVGLWIGLSLLSLCEIFQLIAELCDYACFKFTQNGRASRRRQQRRERQQDERNAKCRHSNMNSNDQWPHTRFNGRDKTLPEIENSGYFHH